jgi:hypothetical protein
MNVEEALTNVAQMPEGSVLVAKLPLTWGVETIFVEPTDDYRVPKAVKDAGYEYFAWPRRHREVTRFPYEKTGKQSDGGGVRHSLRGK